MEETLIEEHRSQDPLFPRISLPRLVDLDTYESSIDHLCTVWMLPSIDSARRERTPWRQPRGAPVKPKNMLGRLLNFKNTRGKKFKFSFIPQILVSHLQHLVGNKERIRSACSSWLRSYRPDGLAIQALIWDVLGQNPQILRFKRTISLKELKDWLDGLTYQSEMPREELSAARCRIFRLFCILKSIDMGTQYASDFSVETTSPVAGEVFKWYVTKLLWEELEMPPLTDTEIDAAIKQGLERVQS